MKHFGDLDFSHHLASGLVWVKTGILLATTPILPYDPRDYAVALRSMMSCTAVRTVLQEKNIILGEIAVVSAEVGG